MTGLKSPLIVHGVGHPRSRSVGVVPATPPSDVLQALGRAVRKMRLLRGLTQERLAEAAGLHPRYVSDVERGRRNVGMVNLDRLAIALGMDLPDLMIEVEAARRGCARDRPVDGRRCQRDLDGLRRTDKRAPALAPTYGSEHTRPTFRIVGLEELVERLAAA